MPVIHAQGDLLESNCTIICHGANCFHTMGAGIAGQIAKKWPVVPYVDSLHHEKGNIATLGNYSIAPNPPTQYIVNLYTQYRPGRNFEICAFRHSLGALNKYWLEHGPPDAKVGMPRIGCGIGGGYWNDVEQIINTVFPNRPIYVYTL